MRLLRIIGWTLGFTVAMAAGLAVANPGAVAGLAKNPHGDKVTICHAAGRAGTTHYITLTIGYQAVYGPAGHFYENGTPQAGHEQDYLGPCRETTTTDTTTTTNTTTTNETTTNQTTTTQTTTDQTTTQQTTTTETTPPEPPAVVPPAVVPPAAKPPKAPPTKRPPKPQNVPPKAPPVCIPGAVETEPCGVQGQG